ncbi:hypothetical protein GJ496_003618, partial [Pomphorhynchus laevis]
MNYIVKRNEEYERNRDKEMQIPIPMSKFSMDRSHFGRSKFKQRNTRKAIGKECNEEFSKTINDDFNEFDPYGPYQRQSFNTAIGYEQGVCIVSPFLVNCSTSKTTEYQTFYKLMDSIMIGTVMEYMNTDAG